MYNIFYQCFKGYLDSANGRFQFGVHPKGLIWNENGRIARSHSTVSFDTRNNVNIAESNWTAIFQKRAVDFLVEQHSAQTMRVLCKMESSQYMRDALELDGPARRTHTAIKRALDLNLHNDVGPSNPRRGYEIQVPSNSDQRLAIGIEDSDSD